MEIKILKNTVGTLDSRAYLTPYAIDDPDGRVDGRYIHQFYGTGPFCVAELFIGPSYCKGVQLV